MRKQPGSWEFGGGSVGLSMEPVLWDIQAEDAHRSFDPEAQGREPSNRQVHKFKSLPCAGLCSGNWRQLRE